VGLFGLLLGERFAFLRPTLLSTGALAQLGGLSTLRLELVPTGARCRHEDQCEDDDGRNDDQDDEPGVHSAIPFRSFGFPRPICTRLEGPQSSLG
jgi:hypothetical protein